MGTRAIRSVAVLFALSLMLTACDPSEVMQLVSDRLVDQPAPADGSAGDAATDDEAASDADDAPAEQPRKKRQRNKAPADDAPAQEKPADNDGGGSTANVSAIEKEIFDTLNATRRKAGLKALSLSAAISKGARAWSCEMARSGNFRHADLRSAGVNGENIAWGQRSAAAVHEGWMNSDGHRRNRMSANWTEYGVGVCTDDDGRRYYTERFR